MPTTAPASRPTLAITTGEPAGIGPEISLKAAWALRDEVRPVLLGDAAFLSMIANDIDPAISLVSLSVRALRNNGLPNFPPDRITVIDCPLEAHVVAGQLDPKKRARSAGNAGCRDRRRAMRLVRRHRHCAAAEKHHQ
jgi:4-hydroxythreonine-4-phosphate dehydrogenase